MAASGEEGFFARRAAHESCYAPHRTRFTEMYYPVSGVETLQRPLIDMRSLRATDADATPPCAACGASLPRGRYFRDEAAWCVPCLQERWFAVLDPRPDGSRHATFADAPVEVLTIIASFLSDYVYLARFARVSTRCCEAVNGDAYAECEMMRVKRILLNREFAACSVFQRNTTGCDRMKAQLSCAQMLHGFMQPGVTRLRKAELVVDLCNDGRYLRLVAPGVHLHMASFLRRDWGAAAPLAEAGIAEIKFSAPWSPGDSAKPWSATMVFDGQRITLMQFAAGKRESLLAFDDTTGVILEATPAARGTWCVVA